MNAADVTDPAGIAVGGAGGLGGVADIIPAHIFSSNVLTSNPCRVAVESTLPNCKSPNCEFVIICGN